jgi:hypothetical protein
MGACNVLEPTNLPADSCTLDPVDFPDITVSDTADPIDQVINTDECFGGMVLTQTDGPDICALVVASLTVEEGAVAKVIGSNAGALVALNGATINGEIDASADTAIDSGLATVIPGPGSALDGEGQPGANATDGAGGAGHLDMGAVGGEGPDAAGAGGAGGATYGVASLSPLVGGSPGAAGGSPSGDADAAAGGGGGGALQLVSCTTMTIGANAAIHVGGSGGDGGAGVTGIAANAPGSGGGGGSGGALLLEAEELSIAGTLAANGGGAGGGGVKGSSATILGGSGDPGADAMPSVSAAAGGAGGNTSAGDGGNGGAAMATDGLPTAGGAAGTNTAAGGGGGAMGRIRINNATGSVDLSMATVSPAEGTGTSAGQVMSSM